MRYALVLIISLASNAWGQNVLIERSYWKEAPTLEQVKNDIAAGNDPAAFNKHTFDAVTWAILEKADDAIVWYLLEQPGNDVNKRSHDGRTPIFWAAYKDNVTLMKTLIAKGAKTDLIDSHGYSLVNFSATTGQQNQEIYDLCLEHGAKFKEESNNDGANPIHLIIPFLEDDTMIRYFKKNGVSLKAEDKHGNNAFTYAAKTGNIAMMEYAIEAGLDPRANNDAAVIFASKGTRTGSVSLEGFQFLQKHGLALNTKDNKGRTGLYYLAAKSKELEILNLFIEAGLKADQTDKEGRCALHQAASWNSTEVVQFLTENCDNASVTNNMGENALHLAVSNGNNEALEVLLDVGLDINAITNEQLSALHLAAMKAQNAEMLKFLIENGANKSMNTQFGETAYDLALENELLKKNNMNFDFLKP